MISGGLVQLIGEFELPPFFIVKIIAYSKLMLERDWELAVFGDDLLDIIGEAIIGVYLLFD